MPRKDLLGWRIYEWCRPKSLADALQIVGAVVATAWFAFATDFGPWQPILPLLAVAFFCFALWGFSLVRQLLYSGVALSGDGPIDWRSVSSTVQPPKSTPAVEFSLPSKWTPGFRDGQLGTHETTGEWIQTEEIHLRVVAKRRMQNVKFEMEARQRRPNSWETMARIGSQVFNGTVQKSQEQGFRIMYRAFWQHAVSFDDRGVVRGGKVRTEVGIVFFPDNEANFTAEVGDQVMVTIKIFHDEQKDDPEHASFIVQLDKNRDFPLSQIMSRHNIEPIMTQ